MDLLSHIVKQKQKIKTKVKLIRKWKQQHNAKTLECYEYDFVVVDHVPATYLLVWLSEQCGKDRIAKRRSNQRTIDSCPCSFFVFFETITYGNNNESRFVCFVGVMTFEYASNNIQSIVVPIQIRQLLRWFEKWSQKSHPIFPRRKVPRNAFRSLQFLPFISMFTAEKPKRRQVEQGMRVRQISFCSFHRYCLLHVIDFFSRLCWSKYCHTKDTKCFQ